MNKYFECVNELMVNHPLESPIGSDSYDNIKEHTNNPLNLTGGAEDDSSDYPSGGFPPIFICDKEKERKLQEEQSAKREYKTHKTTISIKKILLIYKPTKIPITPKLVPAIVNGTVKRNVFTNMIFKELTGNCNPLKIEEVMI